MHRAFVWHAGYENVKAAEEIEEEIRDLIMSKRRKGGSGDEAKLAQLKARYQEVTGEILDDKKLRDGK